MSRSSSSCVLPRSCWLRLYFYVAQRIPCRCVRIPPDRGMYVHADNSWTWSINSVARTISQSFGPHSCANLIHPRTVGITRQWSNLQISSIAGRQSHGSQSAYAATCHLVRTCYRSLGKGHPSFVRIKVGSPLNLRELYVNVRRASCWSQIRTYLTDL
jgi:hypothetical protein